MTYSLICGECGRGVAKYFGESGRNGYTRGGEHLVNKLSEDENKSVLKLHSNYHHNGAEVTYYMRVTGTHTDCLDRQITEGVNISNFRGEILMNRRGEMGWIHLVRRKQEVAKPEQEELWGRMEEQGRVGIFGAFELLIFKQTLVSRGVAGLP